MYVCTHVVQTVVCCQLTILNFSCDQKIEFKKTVENTDHSKKKETHIDNAVDRSTVDHSKQKETHVGNAVDRSTVNHSIKKETHVGYAVDRSTVDHSNRKKLTSAMKSIDSRSKLIESKEVR
jgi:predicted acetyltransferase